MLSQQQHTASTNAPPATSAPVERELPGLVGIGSVIHWIEELVMLLSGPLLTIGLGIALVDLLTGGDLLRTLPFLLFAWGVCQAVGIDSQLVAMWDRARRAIRERHYWALFGYVILGAMLGYVGFISAEAFGFQHAFAVTEAQALARLGIDPINWQLQRAVLAVFLVALSGFTRYHPPAKNVAGHTAETREKLLAEIELEPLRAKLRAEKLRGMRGAVMTGLGREGRERPVASQPAFRAAYEAPEPTPEEYHGAVTSGKMMHDWDIPDIPDETEYDGVDSDPLGYGTQEIPAIDLDNAITSASVTNDAKRKAREGNDSGVKRRSQQSKTTQEAHRARRVDENVSRKRQIREAAYAILDEKRATGLSLDDVRLHFHGHPSQFADEIHTRAKLNVRPSAGTARRQINPWYASRAHKAQAAFETSEPEREFEETLA